MPVAEAKLLFSAGGSPAEKARLSNAVELLIQRCMVGRGFTYFPSYATSSRSSGADDPLPEFPSYSGIAARRANGYGLYASAVKAAAAKRASGRHSVISPETAYANAMSPSKRYGYYDSLFGRPGQTIVINPAGGIIITARSGGCRAEAVTQLYGSVRSYIYAVDGAPLIHEFFINQVDATPTFKAEMRRWAACMQTAGFTFPTPDAAVNDLAHQYSKYGPTSSLRRRETSIAVADQVCATRVALIETTTHLQSKVISNLAETVRRQLQTINHADQIALSELPRVSSPAGT